VITSSDVEYFLAVEAHQSFTSAARALGISQPALTVAMRKLEAKTGLTLFRRSRHGVELTSAAQALLPAVRRARDATRSIEDTAALIAHARFGKLSIACRPALARYPVAPIVGAFARENPGVDVVVESIGLGSSPRSVMRAGLADAAITTSDDNLEGVVVEPLGKAELHAAVPQDVELPTEPSVEDVLRLGLIAMGGFGVIDRALARVVDRQSVIDARMIEADYHGLLARMVVNGDGAAFVTAPVAQHLRRLGARVVVPRERPALEVVAAFLDESPPPVVRRLVELAHQSMRAGSP